MPDEPLSSKERVATAALDLADEVVRQQAEIERLTAELASAGDKYSQSMGKLAEENDRLRAALEKIRDLEREHSPAAVTKVEGIALDALEDRPADETTVAPEIARDPKYW